MMNCKERPVRPERTGWRDEEASARHRLYGCECPATDIDFVMLEYNHEQPVALIELKKHFSEPPDLERPTYRAMRNLADQAGIPFFVVTYWPGDWNYVVVPANERASRITGPCLLDEKEYVGFLYKLRGRDAPSEILQRLAGGTKQQEVAGGKP